MHRHTPVRAFFLALLAAFVLAAGLHAPAAHAAPSRRAAEQPLIANPAMAWNTFLGGSDLDYGNVVAVDGSGNIYVAGFSLAAWGSPVRAYGGGASDGFVAKLDPAGNLIWHTFLGGASGDNAEAIAVDANGNVYVGGASSATWGTPVRPFQFYANAFAAKLDSSGVLQWNTFLGGSTWFDHGKGIAVDGSGNVYLGGYSGATWGAPLRAFAGAYDTLVAKLSDSGVLQWHTFLGGSSYDYGYGLGVDAAGNVYVAGTSAAAWGAPIQAYGGGGSDAYVAKLDAAGAIQWHTFVGGAGGDDGYAITVDAGGSSYVAGSSSASWGAPVRAYSAWTDGFAAKVDSSGALQWNTFLGGSGDEFGHAIGVDGNGVYLTGRSSGAWGAPVQGHAGGDDVFAVKLDFDGALQWNTFLGGSGYDQGFGLGTNGNNSIYIAGYTGAGWGAPVRAYTGGGDAFALKISDLPPGPEIRSDFFAQARKFVAGDRSAFDVFGVSVAMDGDFLVVGASAEDEDGAGSNSLQSAGAAYIFERNWGGAASWGLVKKLVAGDRGEGDQFGISVAIDGDTIVVGANREDEDAAGGDTRANAGAAYIFGRNQGGTDNWGEVKKLVPADRGADDNFGLQVAISGATVVVGANQEDEDAVGANTLNAAGSAYVFERNQGGADNWGEVKKLVAAADRAAGDQFGGSVDIDGDTVVVTAIGEDEDAAGANTLNAAGAAYIFGRNEGGANNWGEVKKLVPADRALNDFFGISAAIDGDTVVVGAPVEDDDAGGANTLNAAGSAYVFERNEGGTDNWGEVQKLVAADRAAGDQFGWDVDIDGDILVVGAHQDDEDAAGAHTLADAGSAYVFARNQGGADNWGELQKLAAGDRAAEDRFGYGVAAAGEKVFVSAYLEDEDAAGGEPRADAGSAYLFASSPPADLAIAKTVALAQAAPGAAITYTIHFTNAGAGIAYAPVIRDSMPAGVAISTVAGSTLGSGIAIAQTSGAPDFAWTVGDLAAGQGGVITLTGALDQDLGPGAIITNTAMITASHDITAENNSADAGFTIAAYNVTTATTGSGSGTITLDPPGGSYPYGTLVTVAAAPGPGSIFTGWSGDLAGSTTPATVLVTANRIVTASFGLAQYTIDVSASPAAGGSVAGGGTVSHGDAVTVTAAAASGYTFVNWTEGPSEVSTTATYVFTAAGSRTLVATFAPAADPLPGVTVTKRANVEVAIVGETALIYSYAITNTGAVPLDVTAFDETFGAIPLVLLPGDAPQLVRTLAPGQVAAGSFIYTPQLGDLPGPLASKVVVTGTAATGPGPVTSQASSSIDLLLRGQPQSMCVGEAIWLHNVLPVQSYGLVVISGSPPADLLLRGVSSCVAYTDEAAMIELINELFRQGCVGSACEPFTYIVFSPDGSSYDETITGTIYAADIFLPLISNACGDRPTCP